MDCKEFSILIEHAGQCFLGMYIVTPAVRSKRVAVFRKATEEESYGSRIIYDDTVPASKACDESADEPQLAAQMAILTYREAIKHTGCACGVAGQPKQAPTAAAG